MPTLRRTNKVEKVRGMNASLASSNGNSALSERAPNPLHITRRQVAFALVLAVLGVIAAIYTVDSVTSGQRTFPAEVTTSKVYDLNFANTGLVTDIMVKVGQRVGVNQPLALQDTTALKAQVAADQTAVTADTAALAQAQAPQLTQAQLDQDTLQLQQAQTNLANAQSALATATSSGQVNVASAQQTVSADQALVAGDTTRYNQACPGGPVAPAANLTGQQLQDAQSAFARCQDLQLQLEKDQASLTTAQAAVPVAQAQAQEAINTAQANVNADQAAVNLAENQKVMQSSPSDPAAVEQAQANLSQAQSQLQAAQQGLQQATLLAPDSGVVAEVYGASGEYLGPGGVRQYAAPAQLPSNQPSGFQLFPAAQSAQSGGDSNTTGTQPLIELIGGTQQIMAQVPESYIHSLPVGHRATVSISAVNTTVDAVVTSIVLNAARSTNTVTYDVILTLDRTVPGLLPGMSASVRPS
jgi:multidrug efflux pump subunit AcrA (membrane-fusion protein)